ncbi:MAG TPA: MFS transporter [Mycobacterium sp.]|nr:MFS transporter [Mycobacterium sp.]HUH68491.1 MFS transporter [Mycobacterium sp.]
MKTDHRLPRRGGRFPAHPVPTGAQPAGAAGPGLTPLAHGSEPGALAVFRVPNYRRFVAGQSVSLVGSWTETIALALLVLRLTHSSIILGLVMATRYAPVLVGTPYAGLIVDRHDKRHVLILTATVLGGASVAVGTAVLTHVIAIWQVFLTAAVGGVMTSLDNPARMAFIPELVGSSLIRRAVTTNSIMANVGRALGPAVAAALVHFYGLGWCFVFNAASFALVAIALLCLNNTALQPAGAVPRAAGQLREGLSIARSDSNIAGPLLMMVSVGTLTYEFETSLPIFAEQTLRAGVYGYSWLTTSFGVGAVMAGVILVKWPQTGLARLIWVAAGYAAAMTLLALSPTLRAGVAAAWVVGAASIAFLTTGNSTVQLASPPRMRGRVMALWTTAFIGSTPIGAAVIGVIAHFFGGRGALAAGLAGCLAAVVAGSVVLRHQGTAHPIQKEISR